jgi:hypothetical protein
MRQQQQPEPETTDRTFPVVAAIVAARHVVWQWRHLLRFSLFGVVPVGGDSVVVAGAVALKYCCCDLLLAEEDHCWQRRGDLHGFVWQLEFCPSPQTTTASSWEGDEAGRDSAAAVGVVEPASSCWLWLRCEAVDYLCGHWPLSFWRRMYSHFSREKREETVVGMGGSLLQTTMSAPAAAAAASSARQVLQRRAIQCSFSSVFHLRNCAGGANTNAMKEAKNAERIFFRAVLLYLCMPWGLLELLHMVINSGNEEYEDSTPMENIRSV